MSGFGKQQEKSLGETLKQAGLITKEQLEAALAEQKNSSKFEPLGKILVRKQFVKEEDIINALKGLLVVIFEINREKFGIEIIFTKEIIKYKKIIPLPNVPDYIKGIISIRDEVITVASLNKRIFGKEDEITEETRIIIIEFQEKNIGIIVDRVVSVENFENSSFENINKGTLEAKQSYISGIIKDKEAIITLIKPGFMFGEKQ
jgi:purine-binding chemotaxis protein CheW